MSIWFPKFRVSGSWNDGVFGSRVVISPGFGFFGFCTWNGVFGSRGGVFLGSRLGAFGSWMGACTGRGRLRFALACWRRLLCFLSCLWWKLRPNPLFLQQSSYRSKLWIWKHHALVTDRQKPWHLGWFNHATVGWLGHDQPAFSHFALFFEQNPIWLQMFQPLPHLPSHVAVVAVCLKRRPNLAPPFGSLPHEDGRPRASASACTTASACACCSRLACFVLARQGLMGHNLARVTQHVTERDYTQIKGGTKRALAAGGGQFNGNRSCIWLEAARM